MRHKHTTIEILYPQRRRVDAEQIQRWASDDLANEEMRTPADWRTIPIEYAVAIVHHHGSVTVAASHGLTLPEYTRGAEVPGVRFYGAIMEQGEEREEVAPCTGTATVTHAGHATATSSASTPCARAACPPVVESAP